MATTVIWIIFSFISYTACQSLQVNHPKRNLICKGAIYRSSAELEMLRGCISVLGNLQIFIEENADFHDMTFDVREVTEYLVIYRTRSLESVGQLFPNLVRIRGERLLNNFALVVFENEKLREIGLFNLLKIDRGGVIMWLLPQACFVNTIDWRTLVPYDRRVIEPRDKNVQCNIPCSCSLNASTNTCWNNKKCQLFLEGPEAYKCDEQCLGCRNTIENLCSLCRHFTHNGACVSRCPSNTILIPENKYCVTVEECKSLERIVWNNTCIADCPFGYVEKTDNGDITCVVCTNCYKTCPQLLIQSIGSIESAEGCVYINGSLTFHLRAVHGATAALWKYMSQIEEVSEFILVEGSDLRSLDFLQSLRRIKGKQLMNNKYILNINDNRKLQTLFSQNVTKQLQIDNGTMRFEMNPKLCINRINELKKLLPNKELLVELHQGTNGYHGNCKEVTFKVELQMKNDTTLKIMFSPINHKAHYSVIYARLNQGVRYMPVVPESCNEFEWHATDASLSFEYNAGVVHLSSLYLASKYVFCIEIYDPMEKLLARSNLFNFSTPLGVPKPPFILELVASSSNVVVVRWVDHEDYLSGITRYELDVALVDINYRGYTAVDYCNYKEDPYDNDYTRHAFVRRPPPAYGRGCESMCGILSTATRGAMVEEYFDVCDDYNMLCDNKEDVISSNTSFGKFVRTLVLNITVPRNVYQVAGLAPFSDYKFRLRACINNTCSRSSRGVVRTLHSQNADIPSVVYAYADKYGYVSVKWDPPKVSNGPILTYSIEVIPRIDINSLLPQSWCVLANETELVVKSVITSRYLVRVCIKTLGSSKSCGDWISVKAFNESKRISWAVGAACGILIYITSMLLGWLWRRRIKPIDVVPLIDSSSLSRVESEPPRAML